MNASLRSVRLACVAAGVAVLLLKTHYAGPGADAVLSYAGNAGVSWAVYFVLAASVLGPRLGGWFPLVGALAAVEAFEIADGFGVMANTYDPFDLAANAAGIGAAWLVDAAWRARWPGHSAPGGAAGGMGDVAP